MNNKNDFLVKFEGIDLSDEQRKEIEAEVRKAILLKLPDIDLPDDLVIGNNPKIPGIPDIRNGMFIRLNRLGKP